jgi:hypothetical protein
MTQTLNRQQPASLAALIAVTEYRLKQDGQATAEYLLECGDYVSYNFMNA